MTFDCLLCTCRYEAIELFLKHMKTMHLKYVDKTTQYKCILCDSATNSKNYPMHYNRKHATVFGTTTEQHEPIQRQQNTVHQQEPITASHQQPNTEQRNTTASHQQPNTEQRNTTASHQQPNTEQRNTTASHQQPNTEQPNTDSIDGAVTRIFEQCETQWSEMLKKMELNRKTVCEANNQVLATIQNTVMECSKFMTEATAEMFIDKVDAQIKRRNSYFKRVKSMKENPYFIPPKKFIVGYRRERNVEQNTVVLRPNHTAEISIKDNLKRLFSIKTLTDAMVFPSDFTNSDCYGHPFTGDRTTKLYSQLGIDFIALSFYCDEFGTVNPLGQAAATNKMMGCYFRVNNFPLELQDTKMIFLGFLALAIDVKNDEFRKLLDGLLIPQLLELENGIEVPYKGQTTVLPVILLNLLGDNLGVHQMSAYTTHFNGNVSCRMCYGSAQEIKTYHRLADFRLKTVENYDRLTRKNDCVELESHGIRNYCVFNRLKYFHVVDASCVDLMHDFFEGHLKKLLINIVQSIIDDPQTRITLEDINDAIVMFPYSGSLAKNKPQKFFLDHVRKGEIKLSSAKTVMNTTMYLPLILRHANISVNTGNRWYRIFLYFLGILDRLLMPKIPKLKLLELHAEIENYLKCFIQLGGHMTVKPHLLLHYVDVMKRFGSLIYCWSMPLETKHKDFKAYERNNCNHKDLAMTLAQRLQEQNIPMYEEMSKENYLKLRKAKKIKDYFKIGEACVYDLDVEAKLPKMGTITSINIPLQQITVKPLKIVRFSCTAHAYEVQSTDTNGEILEINIATLKVHKSIHCYGKYIRLPYAVVL